MNTPWVFKEPDGLPLLRGMTHSIVLHANAGPVSVCPHRYSQYQKDENEREVNGMLEQGIIRNSTSLKKSMNRNSYFTKGITNKYITYRNR